MSFEVILLAVVFAVAFTAAAQAAAFLFSPRRPERGRIGEEFRPQELSLVSMPALRLPPMPRETLPLILDLDPNATRVSVEGARRDIERLRLFHSFASGRRHSSPRRASNCRNCGAPPEASDSCLYCGTHY